MGLLADGGRHRVRAGPLIAAVVSATVTRRLMARFGSDLVAAVGAALYPLAYGWNLLRLEAQPDYWGGYLPAVVATGLGAGMAFPAVLTQRRADSRRPASVRAAPW